MEKYKSPFGLPDEEMRLLGIIAAHFEHLEVFLEMAIAKVARHELSRVAIYTNSLSFTTKLDILTTHVREVFQIMRKDERVWNEYKNHLDRLNKAAANRHKYIHSKWVVDEKTGKLKRHKLRTKGGKIKADMDEVTSEELVTVASEINDCGAALCEFLGRVGLDLEQPNKSV